MMTEPEGGSMQSDQPGGGDHDTIGADDDVQSVGSSTTAGWLDGSTHTTTAAVSHIRADGQVDSVVSLRRPARRGQRRRAAASRPDGPYRHRGTQPGEITPPTSSQGGQGLRPHQGGIGGDVGEGDTVMEGQHMGSAGLGSAAIATDDVTSFGCAWDGALGTSASPATLAHLSRQQVAESRWLSAQVNHRMEEFWSKDYHQAHVELGRRHRHERQVAADADGTVATTRHDLVQCEACHHFYSPPSMQPPCIVCDRALCWKCFGPVPGSGGGGDVYGGGGGGAAVGGQGEEPSGHVAAAENPTPAPTAATALVGVGAVAGAGEPESIACRGCMAADPVHAWRVQQRDRPSAVAPTVYAIWLKANKQRLRAEKQSLQDRSFYRHCSKTWSQLPPAEKKPWLQRHKLLVAGHKAELAAWRARWNHRMQRLRQTQHNEPVVLSAESQARQRQVLERDTLLQRGEELQGMLELQLAMQKKEHVSERKRLATHPTLNSLRHGVAQLPTS